MTWSAFADFSHFTFAIVSFFTGTFYDKLDTLFDNLELWEVETEDGCDITTGTNLYVIVDFLEFINY